MKPNKQLSPLKAARREKILEVAERLFVQQGFRATTMEGVAEYVGMSKVTVYGYFKDKDTLFAAVAERLALQIRTAVSDALGQPGTLARRIADAMVAKHTIVFEVVRMSVFSAELFAAKDRVVAEMFSQLDVDIIAELATCLGQSGYGKVAAQTTAKLIFAASLGVANFAANIEDAKRDISTLVHALVRENAD